MRTNLENNSSTDSKTNVKDITSFPKQLYTLVFGFINNTYSRNFKQFIKLNF